MSTLTTDVVNTVAEQRGEDPLLMDPLYPGLEEIEAVVQRVPGAEVRVTLHGVDLVVSDSGVTSA